MSLHAQIAFGKNFTLQKQLEEKFLNIKRTFKHSRRRLDTLEEECVAALYKLLMFSKEKQGLNESGEANLFNDLFKKSKSPGVQRSQSSFGMTKADDKPHVTKRPATAMSAKTYRQSYSFVKDGLNIDKSRKDRYIRDKGEKERQIENNIKVERLKDDWKTLSTRPMTAVEPRRNSKGENGEENEALPTRPKTACPLPSRTKNGLLSRQRTGNTLRLPLDTSTLAQRSSTPLKVTGSRTPSPLGAPQLEEVEGQSSVQDRMAESPTLKTVHENMTRLDGTRSPLVVRITTTRLNDTIDDDDETTAMKANYTRSESRLDNGIEEELVALNGDDKLVLNESVNGGHYGEFRRHASPYRPATAGVRSPSRNASVLNSTLDGSILRKSAEKTQTFLAQYSRKSKIFGYVVKTRSSTVAPREKLATQRSPCITYQELVSIKASIKQHESRTRSLLQRSAKISSYVDKLARAGEMRQRRHDIKENKNTE